MTMMVFNDDNNDDPIVGFIWDSYIDADYDYDI